MNILNNIWIAISTPNPSLLSILNIPLALFIEIPLSFSLISNLFQFEYKKWQRYLYILTTSLTAILVLYFLKWPFNIIVNYASAFIILFFVMKLNFVKSLIATLFPSIVFNLVGYLLANPYLSLLNINYEQNNTIIMYKLPFSFLTYLIVLIFTSILKYRKITLTILDDFDKKSKSIIVFNFIFAFIYLLIEGVLSANYINVLPVEFTFFNFVCLLVYFGLSFFSLSKIISLSTTKKQLESAEEYNKTLHILHDSVRGFKHDFDNIVTTIGGYINTNDMDGLKNYYSQLEEDCSRVNNLYILNPDNINNPGIYNLLTTKYNEAEEKGIKVTLTVLLDLNDLHMKIYEFARILGILLDNAIDAATECDSKVF